MCSALQKIYMSLILVYMCVLSRILDIIRPQLIMSHNTCIMDYTVVRILTLEEQANL